jgi:ABC-type dipeptide/oligopeptide/nickel transport system permease subunit
MALACALAPLYARHVAPDPSWGTMIAGGDFVFPGIALFLAGLSLNVFGAHLRDAFDPHRE